MCCWWVTTRTRLPSSLAEGIRRPRPTVRSLARWHRQVGAPQVGFTRIGLTWLVAFVVGAPVQGQEVPAEVRPPSAVGAFAGYGSTDGIWKPDAVTTSVGGVILGAFLDAPTMKSWLSIRVEGAWVQRGSNVSSVAGDTQLAGGIRTDAFALGIHTKYVVALGPADLHLAVGPTIDQIVRVRLDAPLRPALNRPVSTLFGATAGIGVTGVLREQYRVGLEGRLYEGLGDTRSGDFLQMRHRSFELVLRVGRFRS